MGVRIPQDDTREWDLRDFLCRDDPTDEGDWLAAHTPSYSTEQRLQCAVLLQAVADYRGQRAIIGDDSLAIQRDALRWFRSERDRGPFSFAAVCESLGLDADYVRERLDGSGADVRWKRSLGGACSVGRRNGRMRA